MKILNNQHTKDIVFDIDIQYLLDIGFFIVPIDDADNIVASRNIPHYSLPNSEQYNESYYKNILKHHPLPQINDIKLLPISELQYFGTFCKHLPRWIIDSIKKDNRFKNNSSINLPDIKLEFSDDMNSPETGYIHIKCTVEDELGVFLDLADYFIKVRLSAHKDTINNYGLKKSININEDYLYHIDDCDIDTERGKSLIRVSRYFQVKSFKLKNILTYTRNGNTYVKNFSRYRVLAGAITKIVKDDIFQRLQDIKDVQDELTEEYR